jgi:hypothetical protein
MTHFEYARRCAMWLCATVLVRTLLFNAIVDSTVFQVIVGIMRYGVL